MLNLSDHSPLNFEKNTSRQCTIAMSMDWYYFWPTIVFDDSPSMWMLIYCKGKRVITIRDKSRQKKIRLSCNSTVSLSWDCRGKFFFSSVNPNWSMIRFFVSFKILFQICRDTFHRRLKSHATGVAPWKPKYRTDSKHGRHEPWVHFMFCLLMWIF